MLKTVAPVVGQVVAVQSWVNVLVTVDVTGGKKIGDVVVTVTCPQELGVGHENDRVWLPLELPVLWQNSLMVVVKFPGRRVSKCYQPKNQI